MVKEFLIFFVVVLVGAIVYATWPAILIIGIVVLLFCIIKKITNMETKRPKTGESEWPITKVEIRERKAEQERVGQYEKLQLEYKLKGYLGGSNKDYMKALSYVQSLGESNYQYALGELIQYESSIEESWIKSCQNGNLYQAINALELLEFISQVHDFDYNLYKENLLAIKKVVDFEGSYINKGCSYGKVNEEIIEHINNIDVNECRIHMGDYHLFFLLWYFAIKEPFDSLSYKTIYSTVVQLKTEKSAISGDAILSAIYVLTKHGSHSLSEICPNCRTDAKCYARQLKESCQLVEFASVLSWIGDKQLEHFALKRLDDKSQLPLKLKGRFNDLKKIKEWK